MKGQETEQETHQNTFKRTEDWAGDSTDTEVGKNKTNVGFYEQRDSKQTEFKLGGGGYYRSTLGIISFLQQTGSS